MFQPLQDALIQLGLFSPSFACRRVRRWLFAVTMHLFLAISISGTAQDQRGIYVSEERLALVIGNSAYRTAPLHNPVNDAEDMSAALSGLGFKVTLKKNVDRRTLEDSVRLFGRQLKLGGVGLFYFAGHGMQVEGRNYLVPIDARIESESDVKYETIDAGFVLGKMEDAQNQLNIVILDACRNNPYARYLRSANKGLARMDAPTGSLIAYSTAPGEAAGDGPERNGIFTKYLIKHMATPGLPIEQVLKRVRIDVALETKQRQIPWESSSLMGDFIFKPGLVKNMAVGIVDDRLPLTEHATIQPDGVIRTNNFRPKKLAIFPFSVEYNEGAWLAQIDRLDELAITVLTKAIISQKSFQAKYSYYDLDKYFQTEKIPDSIISAKTRENLWRKNYFLGIKKPNLDLLCDLGNKLDVGAIITYYIFYDTTTINVGAFMIDVQEKKIIEALEKDNSLKGSSSVSSIMRSAIERQLVIVTSNILKEFN